MNLLLYRISLHSLPVRLLPILLLVLLVSCGESADTPGEAAAVTRITEQQSKAFAQDLERSINARDPEFTNAAVDLESMFKAITRDLPVTDKDYQEFAAEVPRGFSFGNQLVQAMENEGVFRLINFRWDGGRPKALYRMIIGDGQFTYYDLYLGERADSQVTIRDVYIYVTGELFTEAVRRVVMADQSGPLRKILSAATGKGEGTGLAAATDTMRRYTKAGLYREALDFYDKLPAAIQSNKTVQVLRMGAGQRLGDAEYEKILEDIGRRFSGNSSMDLVLLDHYTFKDQHDSTRVVIDRLDKNLGGDPYLDFARASVDIQQNKLDEARQKLLNVVAHDSTLIAPHWALVNVSLKQQDHAETARLLTVIEKKLGIDISTEAVATDSTYANFARSNEFKTWASVR